MTARSLTIAVQTSLTSENVNDSSGLMHLLRTLVEARIIFPDDGPVNVNPLLSRAFISLQLHLSVGSASTAQHLQEFRDYENQSFTLRAVLHFSAQRLRPRTKRFAATD